jgi:adenine C2-methylase RlmN of 23S rRNA A2503 and tRNA A37
MARGDAMANHHVDWDLIGRLKEGSPESHVSISTIFPGVDDESLTKVLYDRFPSKVDAPQLYWSLYSLDPIVRMRWLPKAGRPDLVAKGLRTWSKSTGKGIALHQALIKGVNDSSLNAHSIVNFLVQYDLPVERVNLVRYNPPDTSSEEASWDSYLEHAEIYVKAFGEKRVNLKPRVGFDVKASCGMFVSL